MAILPGKATEIIASPRGLRVASAWLEVADGALAQGVGMQAQHASTRDAGRVDDTHGLGPGRFLRDESGEAVGRLVLAKARTLWYPLDARTGKPTAVSAEVRERFSTPV